ncbi:MAG TPA: peptidylprolyl isomerase [Bryobacteraceae bacterium]|nr:peptidylprolyl isomerase [Bryobacteraceae bacterium]
MVRFILFSLLAVGFACAQEGTPAAPPPASGASVSEPGLYAVFDTSMGQIVIRLLEDRAPETVKNFVALATGAKPSADASATHMINKRFYDGLTFHRVIKGFMIQTGDVNGTGSSNCGVEPIPDEIDPEMRFNVPGRLAMANLGRPDSASCQIFITVGPANHLNGTFTIFGVVSSGQDVADKIASVPTFLDRPTTPVIINKVTIERRDH